MALPGRPPAHERTPAFRTLAALLLPPMTAMADIRVSGEEHIPAEGAFVLSPNHFSEIDPVVVAIALYRAGRAPRFLAKASLWKIPIVRQALTASGQIPVERTGTVRDSLGGANESIAAARKLVADRLPVIVYPEGSLTRDPALWPMRGKTGAVRMALEAGVPLIPAAHWGTQHLMPRYGKGIRPFPRKRIDVRFGAPLDLSRFAGRKDPASLREATALLMDAIAELLGELRGEQPPAERWDPSKRGQSETGRFDG